MDSEFSQRRNDTAALLASRGLDALLVASAPNVRYLSGFTGSNAALLLSPSADPLLFTDPRYTAQAAQETSCRVRTARGPLILAAAKALARRRARRIGFEDSRIGYESHTLLTQNLILGASLVPVGNALEHQRAVKSPAEIEAIRQSCALTAAAFTAAVGHIRAGIAETELAAELDHQMRRRGAEKPAFETIVAFGPHTALPHARPAAANRLLLNQLVLIDMGAFRDGYASDMTRMVFFGRPKRETLRLYRAVHEAQLAALDAVRDGAATASVDRRARTVLGRFGLANAFVHSTGHGLGLEIHEPPRIGRRDRARLRAGMTVTVEPGAYLDGRHGVRIEDTVLVTCTGCEILAPVPKHLLVLE